MSGIIIILWAYSSNGKQVVEQTFKACKGPVRKIQMYSDFSRARDDFDEWLRSWRMNIPAGHSYRGDLLRFSQKTKTRFNNLVESEINNL